MFIKQVSVFVENESGKLSECLDILGENKIDIRALSIADTKDFGILRLIVDKPNEAKDLLKAKNYVVKVNDVVAIRISNEPGGLMKALHILKDSNIQIEYLYAFVGDSKESASVMLKVSDNEKTIELLKNNNIEFIEAEEIQTI